MTRLQRISLGLLSVLLVGALALPAQAQFERKWISGGALHNWYSAVGSEIEEGGFVGRQQDGMRWPGLYQYTDQQAWKGLWIGARDVTDELGDTYQFRVVHAGPRVTGSGEFFPVDFELVSRYQLPDITVDGLISESLAPMAIDRVDPSIPSDVALYNEVNTLLGITMERTVYQFSQEFHDNYHIIEYVFTNTGNTDDDGEIELPNQTLEGVYFFPQWRWAVAQETRYVVGNATGWGKNTMNDTWGDGEDDNLPGSEEIRAQYAWHGYFPAKDISYNNLGGPVLPEAQPVAEFIASTDTLGRLAAYQFVGAATLHADASATDDTDDFDQPTTTTWIHSDDPYQSQNDAFNPVKMETEYNVMSRGHKLPAHAYAIEPGGLQDWLTSTADPSQGTPGGYSAANGYGPYTLAPGESVRIVLAEASSGISREAASALGQQYKAADADDNAQLTWEGMSMTKNEWVFTGRDSLYQTFLRAKSNFDAGFAIPEAPPPPNAFSVESGGDRITLSWDYPADAPPISGFEVWRAPNSFDSTYTLVHEAGPSERTFDDTTPIRGIDYYYYVSAVTDGSNNDGAGRTPAGVPLRSSRYFTQTYVPARLKRQQGTSLDQIRIVPNPFNLGSSPDVRFPDQTDKLAFFNIPGQCRIEIYTELGELVDTIEHNDGSGDAFWDHTTSSRQIVASGVYIAVITATADIQDPEGGGLLFSEGERAIKKFVIIR
jgi:hypothetical protein